MRANPIPSLIKEIVARSRHMDRIQLMEVCGTHTVSLFRSGLKSLLPENIRLISGPGCPVCVTSQGYIDAAVELAGREDITLCTYGDMIRVPGRTGSLESQRAQGAQVVVVYSVRDAVRFAKQHPDRQTVFLAVGFETTAPATAAGILEADRDKLDNFCVLLGHKLVIPGLSALLSAGEVPIDGFLLPGHVSVVIGVEVYRPVVEQFGKPCVVAGFEPEQMAEGIRSLVDQLADGSPRLENAYDVAVRPEGNRAAQRCMNRVFEPADAAWRAMGIIPDSGLALCAPYARFDAAKRFGLEIQADYDPPGCRCGEVIQGKVEPSACGLFGKTCTPAHPVGPCMVSSEGTCAAWYKYGEADKTHAP